MARRVFLSSHKAFGRQGGGEMGVGEKNGKGTQSEGGLRELYPSTTTHGESLHRREEIGLTLPPEDSR